jgi:hypothetical protein
VWVLILNIQIKNFSRFLQLVMRAIRTMTLLSMFPTPVSWFTMLHKPLNQLGCLHQVSLLVNQLHFLVEVPALYQLSLVTRQLFLQSSQQLTQLSAHRLNLQLSQLFCHQKIQHFPQHLNLRHCLRRESLRVSRQEAPHFLNHRP